VGSHWKKMLPDHIQKKIVLTNVLDFTQIKPANQPHFILLIIEEDKRVDG
jgi:hypothetical protein